MSTSRRPPALIPAAMIDRVIARGLDLLAMGTVFCVVAAPLVVAVGAIGLSSMLEPGRDSGLGSFVTALVLGGLAAVCWEPVRQVSKGRTLGRATVGIELRHGARPEFHASTAQILSRYILSLGACGVSIGLAFTAVIAAGMDLTVWRVAGLVAIPSSVVWASALLSAFFRPDRRGWHDLVAGTVSVSLRAPPPRHRSVSRRLR